MNKTLLCNKVQWPVEASFAIHVLSTKKNFKDTLRRRALAALTDTFS